MASRSSGPCSGPGRGHCVVCCSNISATRPTSFPGSLERGETLVGSGYVLP